MGRPTTILGLTAQLLRAYGLRRRHVATAAALTALTVAVAHRPSPTPPRPPAPTVADAFTVRSADDGHTVTHYDLQVVATDDGWLAAWAYWTRGSRPHVQLASLRADGTLRAEPRSVSTPDTFARRPCLARVADRYALLWLEATPDYQRQPRLALVDAAGADIVPSSRISFPTIDAYDLAVAYNGNTLGIAWQSGDAQHTVHFVQRDREGAPVGTSRAFDTGGASAFVELSHQNDQWLVTTIEHDHARDRSTVTARWLDRDGALQHRAEIASAWGLSGEPTVAPHGATSYVFWSDDSTFMARHTPRLARLDGRSLGLTPRNLASRRSGRLPAAVCNTTGCTLAYTALNEQGPGEPIYLVERRSTEGEVVTEALPIPARHGAFLASRPVLASDTSGRNSLALWAVDQRAGGGILALRLDADGRPVASPVVLPVR